MKEYAVIWDIAKNNDASAIQIYRRTPDFVGKDNVNQRMFTYSDLIWQTLWEQVPYTEQVERVYRLAESETLKNNHDLLLDGTGVGQAIADLARAKGLSLLEIVFSGGIKPQPLYMGDTDRRFGSGMDMKIQRGWSVPKVDMIDAAKVMMEQNRIRIADGIPFEEKFKNQLMHFQGKVNEKGHIQYGNDAEAQHDDLVATFLIYCWWAKFNEQEARAYEKPVTKANKTYDWNPLKNYNF